MSWENEHDVVHQMAQFGVIWRKGDLPLKIDHPKRKGCGKGGKWWYWLRSFTVRGGRAYIVGVFGSYKTGESEKVDWQAPELSAEDRERFAAERRAAEARAAEERRKEAEFAAASAAVQWAKGKPHGVSPYLRRKGVDGEACRYLPDGSLLVPLLRYDFERAHALRAVQRIYPGPRVHSATGEALPEKTFTKGFDPTRCSVRLGVVACDGAPVMVCEGYATGLTLRMAVDRRVPVFVALNAGNLASVVMMVREIHPESPILICADDDWRTIIRGEKVNVGRVKAGECAKKIENVHVIYPVFGPERGDKDTDYNDLHARQGLSAVRAQLLRALRWLDPETWQRAA
jgi:putative DNA primase/helicase